MNEKAETFREFYSRRYGMPYPAMPGEALHVVTARIGEALADWADEIAARAAKSPPKPLDLATKTG